MWRDGPFREQAVRACLFDTSRRVVAAALRSTPLKPSPHLPPLVALLPVALPVVGVPVDELAELTQEFPLRFQTRL